MFFALLLVAGMGIGMAGGPVPALDEIAVRDPALLDPFTIDGDAPLWIGIASLLGWGLGYAGQPHILARFMAIRRVEEMTTARRVAMSWVVVVLSAAVVVGLTGLLVLDRPLAGADTEKVFILMSTTFFHPAIAGICLAGILAAVMSTASAQLLVSSSAFAEDFYRGLIRPVAGRGELLWIGRGAVLAIAAVAFWLGLDPDSKVLSLVAWAWAGFGAAFGPAIILSLYWERMTRNGALAGILIGGLTVIVWPQLEGELFKLYELVPGFLFSWLAIWVVSIVAPEKSAGPA
jgi:sodium/proline symporter